MTDVQVVDQLPDTSKDASGANGTSAEVNVSKLSVIKCQLYVVLRKLL